MHTFTITENHKRGDKDVIRIQFVDETVPLSWGEELEDKLNHIAISLLGHDHFSIKEEETVDDENDVLNHLMPETYEESKTCPTVQYLQEPEEFRHSE